MAYIGELQIVMRVLIVSSNSSGSGGGERYITYLSLGLHKLGHEVIVLLGMQPYMDRWAMQLSSVGAQVVRRPIRALRERRTRFVSALADFAQQQRLAKQYRDLRPDVIHINQQYDEDGLDLVLAGHWAQLPFVGTIHLPMCSTKRNRPFGRLRIAAMRAFYHRILYPKILVSRSALDEFNAMYGVTETCFEVANGTFDGGSSAIATRETKVPVIGLVGRLEPQKDPLALIEAFALFQKTHIGSRLLFVGDGSLRESLQSRAADLGVEPFIRITGWIDEPESFWHNINVFALTSQFEGMPQSFIEAACLGKRIAVAPYPGIEELQEHVPWSILADDRSAAAIASALHRSLDSRGPGMDQIERVRRFFSVERMATETTAVYMHAR